MNLTAVHARALATLKAIGAPITFSRTTQSVDEATGQVTPTVTTVSGYAIRVSGDPDRYAALSLTEGSAPTLEFVPSTMGETPAPGDEATWGTLACRVVEVSPVEPAGTVLLSRVLMAG